MDAAGVQSLLFDQKQFIADKLPTEMRSSLGIADMFDTPATGPRAVATPAAAVHTEEVSAGRGWLPWALAAGAAFLAFTFWPSSNKPVATDTVASAPQVSAPSVETLERVESTATGVGVPTELADGLGNIDEMAGGLTERLSGLTGKFASVSDLGSAQELAGELGETNSYLDSMDRLRGF